MQRRVSGGRRRTLVLSTLAAALAMALAAGDSHAGGGPENVFLVVNARSPASQAIANYYIALRQIPGVCVFHIDWDGGWDGVDVDTFRQKLLDPILSTIGSRGLGAQIDYVVYSSDFPHRIDFAKDLPEGQQQQFPSGSLTGMTYLVQAVATKNAAAYTNLMSNYYMRTLPTVPQAAIPTTAPLPTHGFRSWYGWGPRGELLESGGSRYMLSAMLGFTSGHRGNTLPEVIQYLRDSANADGTFPKGTIYFMRNNDVRSTSRSPAFPGAVALLNRLGVRGEIVDGVVPQRARDVQGVMIGAADFDWAASGSRLLPGAIAENFTSYGAIFSPSTNAQTPLTVLLRYGAAGSSGTVVEPFALWMKFPHPNMHAHYAAGCTLAEAYYQAVLAPYQLLVVGDPLCRPWANIPRVEVAGVTAGDTLEGRVTLTPTAAFPRGGKADRFELFLDGVRVNSCGAGETLSLDTAAQPDGYHELRVVAIEDSAIETQGREILPVRFSNHGRSMQFTASSNRVRLGQKIRLAAKAPGAQAIVFYYNNRILGRAAGEQAEVEIDTAVLGAGPVLLRAIGLGSGAVTDRVIADPVSIQIES